MEQILFSTVKPNTTIQVEKEAVAVNSHILALSSDYFDRYFFDTRYPPAENIELPESTMVEDFKRMLASLPPEYRPLDDDCIEATIILAERFSMDDVIKLCKNFLLSVESRQSKLSKFGIAHKFGWKEAKEEILKTIQLDDLADNFVENVTDFTLLDDEGKAAITARHAELVAQKSARIRQEALRFRPASPKYSTTSPTYPYNPPQYSHSPEYSPSYSRVSPSYSPT